VFGGGSRPAQPKKKPTMPMISKKKVEPTVDEKID
jgi:hypothetical protein